MFILEKFLCLLDVTESAEVLVLHKALGLHVTYISSRQYVVERSIWATIIIVLLLLRHLTRTSYLFLPADLLLLVRKTAQ